MVKSVKPGIITVVLLFCGLIGATIDATAAPKLTGNEPTKLNSHEKANIRLFERISPSVVYITSIALERDLFSLNAFEIPQGAGSGIVWNEAGYIVTNYHVIRDAQAARVTLADRSMHEASLIGYEADKDLAVLKISTSPHKLKPIKLGGSGDLKVGQDVLAIGNPFGFDHTLTTGIISGLGREIEAVNGRMIKGVIQTDAAINPGNSGGPLLNSQGRMIGINTAIYSPSGAYAGIGFAVPVDIIKRIVPQLIRFGKVAKPGIGVTFLDDYIARRFGIRGAIIEDVVKLGPAAGVGLRPTRVDLFGRLLLGDIITFVNNKKIENANDFYDAVERKKEKQKINLTFVRGNRRMTTEIEITLE